jgi:cytidylate kinase
MKKIVIAIDGFSSCGKSTLAKQLAQKLDYLYIDSGAMYRAITLYFLRNHVDWSDAQSVIQALAQIVLSFNRDPETELNEVYLNGENVEYIIRDLVVAEKVSEVAALKEVREFAVKQQRQIGASKGIVMDGRDIGTTVFPEAELKLFMTADSWIRAKRRFKEMVLKNPHITLEEVKSNLEARDYMDTHRAISPLTKATDAITIDNSHLTMDEQLELALNYVKTKSK